MLHILLQEHSALSLCSFCLMESLACSYPILFSTFLLIFTALRICYKFKAKRSSISKLPPGPWKLPLLGNLHQFFGTVPLRALRDFALERGPPMLLQLGEVPHVVVSSAELGKEVLKTHDLILASRPLLFACQCCVVWRQRHCVRALWRVLEASKKD